MGSHVNVAAESVWQLIHDGDVHRFGGGCFLFLGVRGCLRNLFKSTRSAKYNKISARSCCSNEAKTLQFSDTNLM